MNTTEINENLYLGEFIFTSMSDAGNLFYDAIALLKPPPQPVIGHFDFKNGAKIKHSDFDRHIVDEVEYEHQSLEISGSHSIETVDDHDAYSSDEDNDVHYEPDSIIYTVPNQYRLSDINTNEYVGFEHVNMQCVSLLSDVPIDCDDTALCYNDTADEICGID